jgi:hypothetical protein
MEVPLPYQFKSKEELLTSVEPVDSNRTFRTEVDWLSTWGEEDELPRILTSVVLLWHAGYRPLSECLHTAIVWERG